MDDGIEEEGTEDDGIEDEGTDDDGIDVGFGVGSVTIRIRLLLPIYIFPDESTVTPHGVKEADIAAPPSPP